MLLKSKATAQNQGGKFYLEHDLFKNVSKGPAFWGQTQIQTIEYGFNDTIRIRTMKLC